MTDPRKLCRRCGGWLLSTDKIVGVGLGYADHLECIRRRLPVRRVEER